MEQTCDYGSREPSTTPDGCVITTICMKAYIIETPNRIRPFGDPVSQMWVGNLPLKKWQEQVCKDCGLEAIHITDPKEIKENSFVLSYDDVFFTRRVLRSLLRRAKESTASVQCALPADSLLVEKTRPLQELQEAQRNGKRLCLYRLYVVHGIDLPPSQKELDHCLQKAQPTLANFKEKILTIPVPKHIMGERYFRHPLTSSVVMHIGHWVHVLWANQLSIQIHWIEWILRHKGWALRKLLSSAVAALVGGRFGKGGYKWSLMKRFNRIGKHCDIHPTALIEFSHLGDGVKIGAYSLVRGSLVGDGVVIEDRVNLLHSVVGPDCFLSKNSKLTFSAGFPDSDLCAHGIQCSLFGSRCAITSFARAIDLKTRGEIRVEHLDAFHSVGTNFLGACFGHDCFVGMDVTLQAGRTVPNQTVLIKPPDQILSQIPLDLPSGAPAWVDNGVAVTKNRQ